MKQNRGKCSTVKTKSDVVSLHCCQSSVPSKQRIFNMDILCSKSDGGFPLNAI